MRSFVADGNFTADHIKQKRPQDDVWLSDGEGMMTAREPYATHIRLATETKEVGLSFPPILSFSMLSRKTDVNHWRGVSGRSSMQIPALESKTLPGSVLMLALVMAATVQVALLTSD